MNDDAQIISVIGGARRSGRWRVPGSTRTLTLFGRCLIDLRKAETTADEVCFSCISVFAGVTFIVPDGAEVRPSGVAVLGSARSLVPVSDTPAHLPPISIDAITVLGRLRIRTIDGAPEAEPRGSRRGRQRGRTGAERVDEPRTEAAMAASDDERKLVDPEPAGSATSNTAPGTNGADGTAAPDPLDRPLASSPTDDPEPVGSIDDHPTAFEADDRSPLEGLQMPDDADGIAPHADTGKNPWV